MSLVSRQGQTFEKGVVTRILSGSLQPDGTREGKQRVVVRMTTGIKAGEEVEMTSSSGCLFGVGCTVGMRVVVIRSVAGDLTVSAVYSRDRGWVPALFAALYLLSLCLVGGSAAGAAIAGAAASLFSPASGITGWNVSDIESLMSLASAGDVRVGRDLMGTDSNTPILAFAGTSISMLALDHAYDLPLLQVLNSNKIGIAVMQGLSGSFGVVLAVPTTVILAVMAYTGKVKPTEVGDP